MRITVEISLYPLHEDYVTPIKEFLSRLRKHSGFEIATNATSTQIVGEHAEVFELLSKEMELTFSSQKAVFVMKVLGFERDLQAPVKHQNT
ncbi:MAG: hypothetical protein JSS62_04695 [Verrucomicrobia bacterium]|nr:hypothetical protein [Verrucomicrobiota bacterium]MBS0645741.1 hypothetical protein [Verrucomicrobiota bacterium]